MKISEVLIALLISSALIIVTVAIFIAYKHPFSYSFVDDSTPGESHIIELDGQGGYEMSFLSSGHKRIFSESGTYSDPGGNVITLTAETGRVYNVLVWGRDSNRPQYRLNLKHSGTP